MIFPNETMKQNMKQKTMAGLVGGILALAIAPSHAEIPPGLVGYTHYLQLDPTNPSDFSVVGTVGSWSWEDSRLGDGVFWRHQADWIAFNLASPARFRFEAERHAEGDNSLLFPSFTLYSGFNDTAEGSHFASNTSDVQWVTEGTPSSILTYLMHHDNSTEGSVLEEIVLPAGDYTLLLGGNAASEDTAVNVNYRATLSAVPIPEPSPGLLGLLAALGGFVRRKR